MDVNNQFEHLYEMIIKNRQDKPILKKLCKWMFIFARYESLSDIIDIMETKDRKLAYDMIREEWDKAIELTGQTMEEMTHD